MTAIPVKPVDYVSVTRLIRILFLAVVAPATASCAAEPSTALATDALLEPGILVTPAIGPDEAFVTPIAGDYDLTLWHRQTSIPEYAIGMAQEYFACGVRDFEATPSGQWVLTGVTRNPDYSPILDIYGDRTGRHTRNDRVYYHFQLSGSR